MSLKIGLVIVIGPTLLLKLKQTLLISRKMVPKRSMPVALYPNAFCAVT
jgi:hypothetical protein